MRYLLVVIAAWFGSCDYAFAQPQVFVGQMIIFAGDYCPRNFAPTNGQIMQISANNVLFSVLGTT